MLPVGQTSMQGCKNTAFPQLRLSVDFENLASTQSGVHPGAAKKSDIYNATVKPKG